MNKGFFCGMVIASLFLVFGFLRAGKAETKTASELKVVNHVEVEKYMGRWYEIATITMWFQKDCAGGTTANYELRDDGTVKVVNSCYTSANKLKQSTGRAWVVDTATNAKLKVSFLPFGLKLAGGDYWIIDLGPNYEYAVVGHPSREYGWILSRTKELPENTLKGIITRLKAQGYDFSKFTMTNQKEYGK
jgi:apolipoprotein D and lipocalin family protein